MSEIDRRRRNNSGSGNLVDCSKNEATGGEKGAQRKSSAGVTAAFRLFHSIYLDKRNIEGLRNYQYRGINTNPLVVYFLGPLWKWSVTFIPRTIHPNLLTLSAFLSILTVFFIVFKYSDHVAPGPIIGNTNTSSWFYLCIALLVALNHHADGLDGCQARRLKLSSPIGELLDHGLDSWTLGMLTTSIGKLFQYNDIIFFNAFGSVIFFLPHWEKQFTTTFDLSWTLDITMTFLVILLGVLAIWPNILQPYMAQFETSAMLALFATFLYSIYRSITNVYQTLHNQCYKDNNDNTAGKINSKKEEFRSKFLLSLIEFFPIILSNVMFIYWHIYSPNAISKRHDLLFNWCHFTLLSHLLCHTIISSMTGIKRSGCHSTEPIDSHCDQLPQSAVFRAIKLHCWDALMTPVLVSITIIAFTAKHYLTYRTELSILRLLTLTITAAQIHFGVCILRQLCEIYNFSFFVVKTPKKD